MVETKFDKTAAILDALPTAIKRAMTEWSEETMTLAKERTPVETGTLRSSGTVEPAQELNNEITQTLGFGGAAAAYALEQHERVDFKHPNGGQAKFLESAVLERLPDLSQSIADAVKDATR